MEQPGTEQSQSAVDSPNRKRSRLWLLFGCLSSVMIYAVCGSISTSLLVDRTGVYEAHDHMTVGFEARASGDHVGAGKEFGEAVRVLESVSRPDVGWLVSAHSHRASNFRELGDLSAARESWEKAVGYARKAYTSDDPVLLDCYMNLARVLIELEEFEEAKEWMDLVIHAQERTLGNDDAKLADSYSLSASIFSAAGDHAESKSRLE